MMSLVRKHPGVHYLQFFVLLTFIPTLLESALRLALHALDGHQSLSSPFWPPGRALHER